MFEQNSYQAYAEASYVGANPVTLVTALYEGAIQAAVTAQGCFATGDIMGRSRAVTKIVNILTELMVTLDHERGGEIAVNLKRLYSYMQQRALQAHLEKNAGPLREVEGLLRDMIEAWYAVAKAAGQQNQPTVAVSLSAPESPAEAKQVEYYGYGEESEPTHAGLALSF